MGSLRKRKKLYGITGLFLVLFLMTGTVSYATEGIDKEIDQQQEEIDRTEQEIRETEQRRKKLEDAKAGMENYLADLNSSMLLSARSWRICAFRLRRRKRRSKRLRPSWRKPVGLRRSSMRT